MIDFSSISLFPPKDWQAFERLSLFLFAHVLNDWSIKPNGRSGQRQHGVDIYGQRRDAGSLVGIQCKGKDSAYGKRVTPRELRQEATLAREEFQPQLDEFILITTAPDDARIDEAARLLTKKWEDSDHPMRVAVWGWNTLEEHVKRHREVLKAFHPDATPFSDQFQAIIDATNSEITAIKAALIENGSARDSERFEVRSLRMLVPTEIDLRTISDPQFFSLEQWMSDSVALTVEPIAYEFLSAGSERARVLQEKAIIEFDKNAYEFRWFQRVVIGETGQGGWLGHVAPVAPIAIEPGNVASHSTQFMPIKKLDWQTTRKLMLSSRNMRVRIRATVSGLWPKKESVIEAVFVGDLAECKKQIKAFESEKKRPMARAAVYQRKLRVRT